MPRKGSGFHLHTDDLRKTGSDLGDFSDRLSQHASRLQNIGDSVSNNARRDRSGVGSKIAELTDKASGVFDKFVTEASRVTGQSGKNLHTGADAVDKTEQANHDAIKKLHPDVNYELKAGTTPKSPPGSSESTPKPDTNPEVKEPKATHPGSGRTVGDPKVGALNNHNIAGPSTEHIITLPDGSEHKIVSTPLNKLEGYHGIKPEHCWDVLKGDGVHRPTSGTGGNANNDWKGWYLAENKEDAAGYSWNEDGQPGAVLKYETPGPVTVHYVPHQLTAETSDGGVNPVTMNALKQHFGIDDGQALIDGLAGKNGVIRTTDGEEGMSEFIVPWDTATGGKVSLEGFVDGMGGIRPKPTRDNGLFGADWI